VSAPVTRRGYLDWLRGVAVLIMIEAHTLDAWTQMADRGRPLYAWAIVLGGFGAPIFLFLAGIALALAAGARMRGGRTEAEVAALALKRGWQVFGLAFLFRLQSWLISGGPPAQTLLKVDILNIMGLSMIAAALLWKRGRSGWSRAGSLAAAAVAVAMLTPLVRAWGGVAVLPDAVEAYLRPLPGRTSFALFPWGGFLLAGGAVGVWLDAARTPRAERLAIVAFAAIGLSLAAGGYAASFLPPIYEQATFWTSSPTFFFLRLGVLIAILPLAYLWNLWPGRSPLREFGASSLFVYWIHVEMVYGVVSAPLHRRLTLEQAGLAFAIFSLFLLALVKLKERLTTTRSAAFAEAVRPYSVARALRDLRGLRG
jgi:uncharacterized membrane protein